MLPSCFVFFPPRVYVLFRFEWLVVRFVLLLLVMVMVGCWWGRLLEPARACVRVGWTVAPVFLVR